MTSSDQQKQRFMITVLWLAGASARGIAIRLGRSSPSVLGIAQRALGKARDDMTIAERQAMLNDLKADPRQVEINLPASCFVAKELRKDQRRAAHLPTPAPRAAASGEPAPLSKPQRKKQRKLERDYQRQRERGFAERRGEKSSALEYLVYGSRVMADAGEQSLDPGSRTSFLPKSLASSGMRRLEAGLILRRYISGTRIGAVGSVNYESTSTGSSVSLPPSEYRLFCIETLGSIRKMVGHDAFELIDAIVDRDDFVWERVQPDEADRIEPAERLAALAAAMQPKIDRMTRPADLTTPRRRLRAAYMAIDAARLQRTQAALLAMAAAHDKGAFPAILVPMQTRAAVYLAMETVVTEDADGLPVDTGTAIHRTPEVRRIWALTRSAGKYSTVDRSLADLASRARQRAVDRTYDAIKRALDAVAVHEGLMTADDYRARWGLEIVAPAKVHRGDIAERARLGAEILAAGRQRKAPFAGSRQKTAADGGAL